MGIFDKLLGKGKKAPAAPGLPEQAVLVHLNGMDLDQAIYDNNDLMTLEELLIAKLEGTGLGELDGNEVGENGATIFLYGPSAEDLFHAIEPVLREYPLCQKARVTIHKGKTGSTQREVNL